MVRVPIIYIEDIVSGVQSKFPILVAHHFLSIISFSQLCNNKGERDASAWCCSSIAYSAGHIFEQLLYMMPFLGWASVLPRPAIQVQSISHVESGPRSATAAADNTHTKRYSHHVSCDAYISLCPVSRKLCPPLILNIQQASTSKRQPWEWRNWRLWISPTHHRRNSFPFYNWNLIFILLYAY